MTQDAIAVVGAEGQVGRVLCSLLGDRVVAWSRRECDLTRANQVRELVRGVRPAVVINAAAYTKVDLAEEEVDLCRAVNVGGVAALAQACGDVDAKLVQISTDYVFCDAKPLGRPWREEDAPAPRGVYAVSKLDGESAAAAAANHLIVRTCGVYGRFPGPPQPGRNFVDTMLALAAAGRSLRVVDDQVLSPTFAEHLAAAIIYLVDADARGLFHVASSGETSWFEFAKAIFEIACVSADLSRTTSTEFGAAAPRPAYSPLDSGKLAALGGPAPPFWRTALEARLQARG